MPQLQVMLPLEEQGAEPEHELTILGPAQQTHCTSTGTNLHVLQNQHWCTPHVCAVLFPAAGSIKLYNVAVEAQIPAGQLKQHCFSCVSQPRIGRNVPVHMRRSRWTFGAHTDPAHAMLHSLHYRYAATQLRQVA